MIPIPACVVVTSPVGGRLRHATEDGAVVAAGDVVAAVDRDGATVTVRAPRGGRVAGALVLADQLVDAGDGVLWLARD